MSANTIELQMLGQVFRLHCPVEQQAALKAAADKLEERVSSLKERSQMLQLEKVLAIVALNLQYELGQETQKNENNKNVLESCISQLDASLSNLRNTGNLSVQLERENA